LFYGTYSFVAGGAAESLLIGASDGYAVRVTVPGVTPEPGEKGIAKYARTVGPRG